MTVPNFEQHGTFTYYMLSLVKRTIVFAVPAFLFVSGYFVAFAAGGKQRTVKWSFVSARVVNLIIPYFIWSTVIFIGEGVVYGRVYSGLEYLRRLLFGQATSAYYYVPLLIQLYLLSPLLIPIARNRWRTLLIGSAIVQFALELFRYFALLDVNVPGVEQVIQLTPLWFFPRRMFWFMLGMIFGFHYQHFKPMLAHTRWWLLATTVTFLLASLVEFEILYGLPGIGWLSSFLLISSTFYAAAFLLCFLAFENLSLPFSGQLSEIGTRSYSVYLLNTYVLDLTGTALYFIIPKVLGYQFLYQPVMIVAGLGIPLLLMAITRRSPARRAYRYLFG